MKYEKRQGDKEKVRKDGGKIVKGIGNMLRHNLFSCKPIFQNVQKIILLKPLMTMHTFTIFTI